MPRVVGLEIGANVVRAVEVQGTPRALEVVRFFEQAIVESPPPAEGQLPPTTDPVGQALETLFTKNGLSRSPLVAAIDADQMAFRHVHVPFAADDAIRRTVPFELEHHVFTVAAENAVVGYYKVRQAESSSLLFVATASKEVVGKHIRTLASCGVDPIALDVDVMAIFNCFARCGAFTEKPNALVLSLDATSCRLIVIQGGRFHSARTIRVPAPLSTSATGDRPSAASAAPAPASRGSSETPKLEFHLDMASAKSISATLRAPSTWPEYAARLEQEVGRAMLSFPVSEHPTAVIITGSLPGLPDRASLIGGAFGLPVEVFDPSKHFTGSCLSNGAASSAAALAAPLGLALKGLEYDMGGIDFRQSEFRYEKRFDAIKRGILTCATLVLLFFVLVGFHFYLRRYSQTRALAVVTKTQNEILVNAYPEASIPPGSTAMAVFTEELTREQALYGRNDTPLILSCIDVWKQAFEEIYKFDMIVTKIQIDQSRGQMRAIIDGTGDTRGTIEQVCNRLKAKPDFSGAMIMGGMPQKDPRYGFQFVIPLPERENAQ